MIEDHIVPADGTMAVVTDVDTGYMCRMFTGGGRAVVAAETGADNGIMIDPDHRLPSVRIVAVIAGIGGQDMGRVLACRRHTVMATDTGAGHTTMIESRTLPTAGTMTIITGIRTVDMARVFT